MALSMVFAGLWKRMFATQSSGMPLYFYNTLGKAKEKFELPPHGKMVKMYNCGPTVYGPQHIGNLSMFVFTDVLRRTLEYNDFSVRQVINFTDFGHLTSDADEGEDKMMRGLKREGLKPTLANMRTMAKKYADLFKEDLKKLNIDVSAITFPFASDYIPAQIAMIQTLVEKAYAYKTKNGVYFDTSRFPSYGELGSMKESAQLEGARVAVNPEKRNPTDFILWKSDGKIGWESPWGTGFPGWHIECSAMINSILGKQIDIHTGGIEHISIHHNNEIAQSEAATGKRPFSRFWLHRGHLQIGGAKIAKSEGNTVYLSDVMSQGYHPLSLRYLYLGAHYRTSSNFTPESLKAAETARKELCMLATRMERVIPSQELPQDIVDLKNKMDAARASKDFATSDQLRNEIMSGAPQYAVRGTPEGSDIVESVAIEKTETSPSQEWRTKFEERMNDDLDTPGALAVVWDMTKDKSLSPSVRRATLLDFDRILGLGLDTATEVQS